MKKGVTKKKMGIEDLADNIESFQGLVVKQFDRVWTEFAKVREDLSDVKRELSLLKSEQIA